MSIYAPPTATTPSSRTYAPTPNPYTQQSTVYNLTVDNLHTYYVRTGNTGILVHNDSCWAEPGGPGIWGPVNESKSLRSAAYQEHANGLGIGAVEYADRVSPELPPPDTRTAPRLVIGTATPVLWTPGRRRLR